MKLVLELAQKKIYQEIFLLPYVLTVQDLFEISSKFPDAEFMIDTNMGVLKMSYIYPPVLKNFTQVYSIHFIDGTEHLECVGETRLFMLIKTNEKN